MDKGLTMGLSGVQGHLNTADVFSVLYHCGIKPRQGHSLILKGILHIVGLKSGILKLKNAAVTIQIQPTVWKVNRYVIAMLIYGSKKPKMHTMNKSNFFAHQKVSDSLKCNAFKCNANQ